MNDDRKLYFGGDYMAYELLGKLYYKDQSAYAQMYKSRFHSEDTVKLDFYIGGYQAFFVQNTEVIRLAYHIAKLDKSVSKLSVRLPGVAKLQYSRKCLIDEIVLTNNIEGVYSSRKEIGKVLSILEKQSGEKRKHHRFIGLVNKYHKLMSAKEVPLATCQDIRDIYNEVFLSEVITENSKNAPDGKIFRKDMTEVCSQTGKVIHKGICPEDKIIDAMDRALAFLNDDSVDRLFRFCIFHYLIEYIHPFYDGNGRLGRFILSYCLSKDLEPLLSYRISETIKENIREYYKAFQTCNDNHNLGDLTPFLIMLLTMIHTALKDLNDSLNRKLISWRRYEDVVGTFPEVGDKQVRRMYSYLIQAALFSENGISTEELKNNLHESYYHVKKILDQIRPELLISEMNGKEKCYWLNLQVLDKILLEREL